MISNIATEMTFEIKALGVDLRWELLSFCAVAGLKEPGATDDKALGDCKASSRLVLVLSLTLLI